MGVDGNYISPKMADILDKDRTHRIAKNELTICRGVVNKMFLLLYVFTFLMVQLIY